MREGLGALRGWGEGQKGDLGITGAGGLEAQERMWGIGQGVGSGGGEESRKWWGRGRVWGPLRRPKRGWDWLGEGARDL